MEWRNLFLLPPLSAASPWRTFLKVFFVSLEELETFVG